MYFRNIPLSTEEQSRILAKLLRSIDDLTATEVPPLGHNLLLLTQTQGLTSVLFAVNAYYQRHLYSKPRGTKEIGKL